MAIAVRVVARAVAAAMWLGGWWGATRRASASGGKMPWHAPFASVGTEIGAWAPEQGLLNDEAASVVLGWRQGPVTDAQWCCRA